MSDQVPPDAAEIERVFGRPARPGYALSVRGYQDGRILDVEEVPVPGYSPGVSAPTYGGTVASAPIFTFDQPEHVLRIHVVTEPSRRHHRGVVWWCLVGWWWRPVCWSGRVLLWLVCWPLGLCRSIRHAHRTR